MNEIEDGFNFCNEKLNKIGKSVAKEGNQQLQKEVCEGIEELEQKTKILKKQVIKSSEGRFSNGADAESKFNKLYQKLEELKADFKELSAKSLKKKH